MLNDSNEKEEKTRGPNNANEEALNSKKRGRETEADKEIEHHYEPESAKPIAISVNVEPGDHFGGCDSVLSVQPSASNQFFHAIISIPTTTSNVHPFTWKCNGGGIILFSI